MAIRKSILNGIRWFTRTVGSLLVLLVLVIAIGGAFTEPPPQATGKIMPRDILLIIGMVSIVVGIVIAWFREGLGGFLNVGGFVFFFAVRLIVDGILPGEWFLTVFFMIGLLFIFCWWQSRKLGITET